MNPAVDQQPSLRSGHKCRRALPCKRKFMDTIFLNKIFLNYVKQTYFRAGIKKNRIRDSGPKSNARLCELAPSASPRTAMRMHVAICASYEVWFKNSYLNPSHRRKFYHMIRSHDENHESELDDIQIELECRDVKPDVNSVAVTKIENLSPNRLPPMKDSEDYQNQNSIKVETISLYIAIISVAFDHKLSDFTDRWSIVNSQAAKNFSATAGVILTARVHRRTRAKSRRSDNPRRGAKCSVKAYVKKAAFLVVESLVRTNERHYEQENLKYRDSASDVQAQNVVPDDVFILQLVESWTDTIRREVDSALAHEMAKRSTESAVVGEYEATENQELRNPLTLDQDQGETSVEVTPPQSLCEKRTHKKISRRRHLHRDRSADATEKKCFTCSQVGHKASSCPYARCRRCSGRGHRAKGCPEKEQVPLTSSVACQGCGKRGVTVINCSRCKKYLVLFSIVEKEFPKLGEILV
ncbi:unnamed protein product [Trichogramma brassicae]|uniref:CCHC-type domain-containing protein n=1 Tax=Trichogramma brassicae TaxID=86971 RepID=A0A6H5IP81_9HYME|nr:unnamed protein product [Trichogramma brassicae]